MTYQEALLDTITKWKEYPIANEWLFAEFRESSVSTMSTIEAFESIDETLLMNC